MVAPVKFDVDTIEVVDASSTMLEVLLSALPEDSSLCLDELANEELAIAELVDVSTKTLDTLSITDTPEVDELFICDQIVTLVVVGETCLQGLLELCGTPSDTPARLRRAKIFGNCIPS